MKVLFTDTTFSVLRFDTGEDVLGLFATYCQENSLTAGSFSGLGAAGELILAYYHLETKQYEDHTYNEDVEIVTLTGNIARMEGKLVIHCHGVFGRPDMSTIGGHVKKLIVSATCELTLSHFPGNLTRAYHEKTGLNLLV